jgi:hypothetical protein
MAIPARWWLCPDCLNGFDDQPFPPWHWADDECQGRCNGVPIEVVPADHPRGAVSDRVQCGPDCRREDNLRCSCDQCQDNCVCALGHGKARCPDTPPTQGAV